METQQELADFIKSVHINLRLRARDIGPTAAWEEHCADKEKLQKYAKSMRTLASLHWEKSHGKSSELSRIFWVLEQIQWYFNGNGRTDFIEKEKKLADKFLVEYKREQYSPTAADYRVSLLDVGSCYNPFSQFCDLNVTAIDLAPGGDDVLKCDFLTVKIGDKTIIESNNCTQLPEEYFDVVVFSLLLGYMPSPAQRFLCCKKANLLLKKEGLLFILSPDSKHETANSKLLKTWRLSLASIGFVLLKKEKLKHLNCLVYVKSNDIDIPKKWLSVQKVSTPPEEGLIIPQDTNLYEKSTKELGAAEMRSESDNNFVAEGFSFLIAENDIFL